MSESVAVLIPIKAFADAKARLEEVLDAEERSVLARQMAEKVVAAAKPLPITVVCDDDEVAIWATALGVSVLRVDGPGLNRAVATGVEALAKAGFKQAIVAHADLPRATDLSRCASFEGITLVPDQHGDGTPVASVPTKCGFRFAYGPGSFAAHIAEAERLELPWRSLPDPDLGFDIDAPEDLEALNSSD